MPVSPVASMTGFARAEGVADGLSWAIELRTVNGRGFELRCRLPSGLDWMEARARTLLTAALKRGTISLSCTVTRSSQTSGLRLNRAVLDQIIAIAREVEEAGAERPRIDSLLMLKGVIEVADDGASGDDATVRAALDAGLSSCVAALIAGRLAEGRHLVDILGRHFDEIERLAVAASGTSAAQPEQVKARLRAQLRELLDMTPMPSEDRLAQELAMLAGRSDVREELDRLIAHVAQGRDMLREGGAVGRKLDFLCQELMREANTVCSKSSDLDLTRIGIDLKAAVEQLREQVQNVE